MFCHWKLRLQVYDGFFWIPGRVFREVELGEPIRYALGDAVEGWLNELLCLNAANHIPKLEGRYVFFLSIHCTTDHKVFLLLVHLLNELSYALLLNRLPHPSECRLYYVNRDTLFSYHKASEVFLQVTICNTKYDLQMSQWNVVNVLPV